MLVLTGAFAALSAPAVAQSYQCALPSSARLSVPPVRADGPARQVPVTGYTLALSWSPEYCRTRTDKRADARQCSGREGRYGLIVHGLWPQGAQNWPQWCPATQNPSSADLRANMCLSPSASLLARQWAKHGSCMARKPATYFRVTRILYNGLRWPDFDRMAREDGLNAGMIRTRFAEVNPGWRADAVGVKVNRRGWLEELRLCYDRRFIPTPCSRARFGPRDSARVKIWRGM